MLMNPTPFVQAELDLSPPSSGKQRQITFKAAHRRGKNTSFIGVMSILPFRIAAVSLHCCCHPCWRSLHRNTRTTHGRMPSPTRGADHACWRKTVRLYHARGDRCDHVLQRILFWDGHIATHPCRREPERTDRRFKYTNVVR